MNSRQVKVEFCSSLARNLALLSLCISPIFGCGKAAPVAKAGSPGSADSVAAGDITLGKEASYEASMTQMLDLPDDNEYGIDFVYGLKMDQAAHLSISDKPNYDCDFGTYLSGASYFLYLEDGSERSFKYEKRSEVANIPGRGIPNFPDLVPAGTHRLIVRYYANGVCHMNGSVTVTDRFSPDVNSNYVTDYSLLGDWKGEKKAITFSSAGTYRWTIGDSVLVGKAYNFGNETVRKLVLTIDGITGAAPEKFAAGQRLYCAYETSGYSPKALKLRCSEPNTTSFQASFEGSDEFSH